MRRPGDLTTTSSPLCSFSLYTYFTIYQFSVLRYIMLYFRRENKEKEEKKQAEAARLHAAKGASKTAPWCQSNFTPGLNLTDIQKAEKEKRASEVASQIQKQQQLQELQQQQIEKSSGLQLNWAKKPIETRKVKSVAEIQAEEQERLSKLSAEARLAAQLKEKEAPVSNSGSIWNGQSLSWANVSSTSQWSSSSGRYTRC